MASAPVDQPLRPCDDDDDRSLIENGGSKEATQPWALGHPPQKTARALRVPVMLTRLMGAGATASRRQCEREATAGEAVGWPRWRRPVLEQTRDKVIVLAPGPSGLFHLAAYALLLGGKLKDGPPDMGSRQQVVAKFRILEWRSS